jgi:hypothetical protein
MRNRFPATCAACGQVVPVDAGTLARVGDRWRTQHDACPRAPVVAPRAAAVFGRGDLMLDTDPDDVDAYYTLDREPFLWDPDLGDR